MAEILLLFWAGMAFVGGLALITLLLIVRDILRIRRERRMYGKGA